MRLLIAGCGYVGTALGLQMAARGHEVWGLRRSAGDLPSPIRPLAADLNAPGLEDRLPEIDHVVYAAAADGGGEAAYRAIYVDGVRNLIGAIQRRGFDLRRFVFVSSTAVYGDAGGDWVDESTPTVPDGYRGGLVLEGEALTLEGPFTGGVLRLGGIYGPGRTRLLERVRRGEAHCSPGDPVWSNRIHRDDAAGALAHLLALDAPSPIYLGVDDEPAPLCEVYRWLAALLGAPAPRVDPAAGRERSNKRCSNRLLRESGYAFRYPSFREGYRSMVEGVA